MVESWTIVAALMANFGGTIFNRDSARRSVIKN